jgi:hypothetical protein
LKETRFAQINVILTGRRWICSSSQTDESDSSNEHYG